MGIYTKLILWILQLKTDIQKYADFDSLLMLLVSVLPSQRGNNYLQQLHKCLGLLGNVSGFIPCVLQCTQATLYYSIDQLAYRIKTRPACSYSKSVNVHFFVHLIIAETPALASE